MQLAAASSDMVPTEYERLATCNMAKLYSTKPPSLASSTTAYETIGGISLNVTTITVRCIETSWHANQKVRHCASNSFAHTEQHE